MHGDNQVKKIGLAIIRISRATSMETEVCAAQECAVAISEGVL